MARIIGGIVALHTPSIGFAFDGNRRDYPVWAPRFLNASYRSPTGPLRKSRTCSHDLQRSR